MQEGILNLYRPTQEGMVLSKKEFEILWSHCLEQYTTNMDSKANMLICESVGAVEEMRAQVHKKQRELLIELTFEQAGLSGFYSSPEALLALIACGKTIGLAFKSGAGSTEVIRAFDGHIIMSRSRPVCCLTGSLLSIQIIRLIIDEGYYTIHPREAAGSLPRHIKSEVC